VTRVADTGVPDADYAAAAEFSDKELADLTYAIGLMNAFNRFGVAFRLRTLPVGTGYAVWTGIGAAGTAILGMALLGDSTAPLRLLCIALILAGVIGLKLVTAG
jgi:quaternary ammonium compound-resistance protein SugE